MGRSQRTKGNRGELEVAHAFQAAGFDADRTPNSGGLRVKGDLQHTIPSLHVEVKRQERLAIPTWLRQAAQDAGDGETPAVIFRQNRRGGNVGEWHAIVPLTYLLTLLGRAA